jgi:hypothetical protein
MKKFFVILLMLSLVLIPSNANAKSAFNNSDCITIQATKTKSVLDCKNGLIGIAENIRSNYVKVFWFFKNDFNKNFTCSYLLMPNKKVKVKCVDPNNYKI